jgi:hypothetical protein
MESFRFPEPCCFTIKAGLLEPAFIIRFHLFSQKSPGAVSKCPVYDFENINNPSEFAKTGSAEDPQQTFQYFYVGKSRWG